MRDTAIPNKSKSQLISICKLKLVKMFYKQKANITEKSTCESKCSFWWTIRDSNPGPTGYEPVALTN